MQGNLPENGPWEDFAAFVVQVLQNNGSAFISPTLDPEPSQTSPYCTNTTPEPTADGELEQAAMQNSAPVEKSTEPFIASELEPHETSDQVYEPATPWESTCGSPVQNLLYPWF